ncbi:MAG: FecR domain-containing protein [Bacteroidales bacterium]|nr:FecR domain-containing protein [Bacteroidales bacterium]MDD4670373.1 FecR domain-containing protein [Bacteroidales bacterium]
MEKDEHIWEIISAKFAGEEIDVQDEMMLEEWLNGDSDNLDAYLRFNNLVKSRKELGNIDIDEAYRKVTGRLKPKRKSYFTIFVSTISVAAAAVILMLVLNPWQSDNGTEMNNPSPVIRTSENVVLQMADGNFVYLDSHDSLSIDNKILSAYAHNGTLQCSAPKQSGKKVSSAQNYIKTPVGKDYKVVLGDGTIIQLNSDSYLSFPSEFEHNERRVKLQGEAFFSVSKSAEWPFIVETDNIAVRVTGTCFDVKAYENDENVYATLVNGSVKVIPKGIEQLAVELAPSEQYSLNTKNNKQYISQVDPSISIAWTREVFAFRNQSLSEVMKDMSRWFNVKYRFMDNQASNVRISGNIEKNKGIDAIMDMIANLNKVSIKVENGEYKISAINTQ